MTDKSIGFWRVGFSLVLLRKYVMDGIASFRLMTAGVWWVASSSRMVVVPVGASCVKRIVFRDQWNYIQL